MFGYVKPYLPDLKVRQSDLYKAVYCGLCKRQRKLTGVFSTFYLSYDFVFLALVRMAINNEEIKAEKGRCIYNPLKHRPFISQNKSLDYSACAASLLAYYKLRDDISDSKGIKKIFKYLLLPFAKAAKSRALKHSSLPENETRRHLQIITEKEKKGNALPEELAEEFGSLLSDIAVFGLDELESFALDKIFDSLGRWIYLIDAVDDLEQDIKKGRFNPFDGRNTDRKLLEDSLDMTLSQGDECILRIHSANPDISAIIANIYHLGTGKVQNDILTRNSKNRKEILK